MEGLLEPFLRSLSSVNSSLLLAVFCQGAPSANITGSSWGHALGHGVYADGKAHFPPPGYQRLLGSTGLR
jgi:hypothetical protein